jgi:hypothetical protein
MTSMTKDNAIKSIQGMVKNILVQIPQYFIGTKYIQLASSANDLIGLGVAWGMTPSSIPIGISVDKNGELTFREPEIKVLGAVNEIKRVKGQEDVILTFENTRHPLIVINKDEPPVYTLAYNIMYGNDFYNLKNFIYDAKEWKDDKAIDVNMWIKKYPSDNLDSEPVTVNYTEWSITPNEVVKNLNEHKINGQSLATLNVTDVLAGQKMKSPFPSFSFGGSPFVVRTTSTERGIFSENFNYKIYEYKNAPLSDKTTKIKPLDRMIFKVSSVKDLRKNLFFYHYNKHDGTLAITNKNDFSVTIHNSEIGSAVDEEWELLAGETRLFS